MPTSIHGATMSGARAARVGDQLACPSGPLATLLGPGAPTVLIGGKGVARVGDLASNGAKISHRASLITLN